MRILGGLLAVVVLVSGAPGAGASDDPTTDVPVLAAQVPRGAWTLEDQPPQTPTAKIVDGDPSDWVGSPTRFGGTAAYSAGEYVYQDHLFDAYGADDGRDAQRLEVLDPAAEAVPETYRLDSTVMADIPGEQLGLPLPEELRFSTAYGDAEDHHDESDLHEVRVAADASNVYLLARATTLTAPSTALLILADTGGGEAGQTVPFDSGLTTQRADIALFISGSRGLVADLSGGSIGELPAGSVATDPGGYSNAIEAAIPRDLLVRPGKDCRAQGKGCEKGAAFQDRLFIAVASGAANGAGDGFAHLTLKTRDDDPHANPANVAFRFDEPVREWFDKRQALALHAGTIDPFFADIDPAKLQGGASEALVVGGGYHDRIFVSSETISRERGRDGIIQHYGLYVPEEYEGQPLPLQYWLHWRGGNAHQGAHLAPRIFKHFGEDMDTIVAAPAGRGTSRWYVGKGHVDFLEVSEDVFETFAIDRSRVYVSGHSMGGWGSYLLTILYPDRFAAGAPVAGPVTQGAWFGIDNCNPCYVSANGGRPRDQHTRKMLENLRHVPLAILQGLFDELVPYAGVARNAERLMQLGYRHRFYTYPTYEHFGHPINDQWSEAARYMHGFAIDDNPARVTYKRDMAFERAVEEVQSDGVPLSFDFDSAYWMSELTPVDDTTGVASFDGMTRAIVETPSLVVPDTAPPASAGSTGPYVVTGLQWLADPTRGAPEPANAFEATLTGARAVRLDLARMGIDTSQSISAVVENDAQLELRLAGDWPAAPNVTVNGAPVTVTVADGVLTILLDPGTNDIAIG